MPLSWNEIRRRAIEFSQEYRTATRENAETQTFYNDFFNVFGISRRRVASFEEPVKKLGAKHGRIDLFWKGTLLVEQKSGGRDLEAAYTQALDYFPNLKEEELPRYILVSDFQRFELYDLETKAEHRFTLAELHTNVELFGFIAGYQKREFKDQDPVNIEASERMGRLYDALKDAGYEALHLELFLVRILFCLFADDTGIFEKDSFRFYLEENTREDGSDTGPRISHLFQVLNTPHDRRGKNLNEALAAFPYINGKLFETPLPIPDFNSTMRQALISTCYFNWGQISPAIFGSLFQSVMDKEKRRGIGAHYTTEKNILKIINPLFLDELRAEFERIKHDRRRVQVFHDKLAKLTFLDPACGCGNFLILAYRELRLLEIEVLKVLYPEQLFLDVAEFSRINVDAFYGIEIEEFPARIAEVALWLTDHQMNMRLSEAFGLYYVRIPLKAAAHIHHGNALKIDWETVVPKARLSYIMGNPPFIGHHLQTPEQKNELRMTLKDIKAAGVMDYVSAWYMLASQYIQNTTIVCAFVSTNSITQGEQVGILWQELLNRYSIKIHFAHRTFKWSSEARGKAAVFCVIIGFASFDTGKPKRIYEYKSPTSDAQEVVAKNINPYLVDAPDIIVTNRSNPICDVPGMHYGNKPTDGGNFLMNGEERDEFLRKEPNAAKFIKPYISAREFLNGERRWCLWLLGASPNELKQLPEIMKRVEAVKAFRAASEAETTRGYPYHTLFRQVAQPDGNYILIPIHTSENRKYVPFGFLSKDDILSNACMSIPDASLYHFGVITSEMHMTWMRYVCGRIKGDYRYSKDIVYNNFPWPQPTPAQAQAIEKAAQGVLDARALFPDSTLAELYDPLAMPPVLLKAHQLLDRAVELAYRKQPFETERHRVEHLFEQYQQLTEPLMSAVTKETRRRRKSL